MRPRIVVPCAAGLLLLAAAQWGHAQSGPLISSGRAAVGGSSSASTSLSTTPTPLPPAAASSSGALRERTLLEDQSWTRSSPPASLAQFTSSDPAPAGSDTSHVTDAPAKAQEPRALKPPSGAGLATPGKRSNSTVQMFISVVSSLLIVIGLVLGAAWCYRKAAPHSSGNLPKQVVQVLGRTPLAPRQQLILVRFGSKLVLVSNLQGEVRTISEIVDPLEVDRVAGMCENTQAGSISDSFRTVLHNIGRTG